MLQDLSRTCHERLSLELRQKEVKCAQEHTAGSSRVAECYHKRAEGGGVWDPVYMGAPMLTSCVIWGNYLNSLSFRSLTHNSKRLL